MSAPEQPKERNLIWVYTGSLDEDLDAASWLETTKHLREMGWRVTLIHAGPSELKEINEIEVSSVPKPDIYLVRQAIFHLRILREVSRQWQPTSIIFFHQMSAPWLLPLRYLRQIMGRELPLIIMDTRTAPMIPKELATRRDRLRTLFDNGINYIANYMADGQTAITKRMAQMMGIPDQKLLGIWPSGVNYDSFSVAQQNRNWDKVDEEVHVIYVGALHHPRNLMNFCRAVVLANDERRRIIFTLVGDGSERDELIEFASGTDGIVRVLPPVLHEEIPSLLAAAHIGVLPFPDQERFRVSSPIKLFEYMASGMPILATHITCHTDVVMEGNYAFWAYGEDVEDLVKALIEVWEQRHTLQEKGQAAAADAQNWTWEASARKLSQSLQNSLTPVTIPAPSTELVQE